MGKMDADRKKVTFDNLYKYLYTAKDWDFWGLFDFENPLLSKGKDGYMIGFKENIDVSTIKQEYQKLYEACPDFSFSGDADYTFKRINVSNDIEQGVHKFPNFSLMPVQGNLNQKKGLAFSDRLDRYIYKISGYYEKQTEKDKLDYIRSSLFNTGNIKKEYQDAYIQYIHLYLSLFESIEQFCNRIYYLDKPMVEKMKKAGNGKIDEELIKAYWELKKDLIEKRVPDYNKYITEDISNDEYK